MADWTIMVYISADNILANFAIESLKQLRDAAGKQLKDDASDRIVVVAEFADHQEPGARMYFFDGTKCTLPIEASRIEDKELQESKLERIHNVDMTRPETLTDFINYACQKSRTERYSLVLWGHGIELLLDEERRFPKAYGLSSDTEPVRRYLTPSNLKTALQDTNLAKGKLGPEHPKTILDDRSHAQHSERIRNLEHMSANNPKSTSDNPESRGTKRHALDILGMDACSMSMIEIASELQDHVDFMIASQDDVPDMSFPYEKILTRLKEITVTDNVTRICEMIPRVYGEAFRDYIATPGTGVRGITLASLELENTAQVTKPLGELASNLLASMKDEAVRKAVFSARKNAQDFVFGLLVDLCDFCERLRKELDDASINNHALRSACKEICDALQVGDDRIVVVNQIDERSTRCHGLSIYFPYRDEDETDKAEEQFAKGGGRQPLKGGGRQPLKERTARIQELEADFARLNQFQQTRWNEFIARGWSVILANETPFELDRYYSAEQVAQNLKPSEPEKAPRSKKREPGDKTDAAA